MNDKKLLLLLSGGRDSLLSACLCIEEGYRVVPVICNNGHIEGVDRADFAAKCLQERYGKDKVDDLARFSTGMSFHTYMRQEWYRKSDVRLKLYPELQTYQAHCLACKCAMYIHAISFCKANHIETMADGMRESQGFFVDMPEMRSNFNNLCSDNGIHLITPVYDLTSDLERKKRLCDRGLPTKTLEPQCFLGCPLTHTLSPEERMSLTAFYTNELAPYLQRDIDELVLSKRIEKAAN